jgi:hypothetical protein
MSVADAPQFTRGGYDGSNIVVETEYTFYCGVLAYGGQNLAPNTVVTPPLFKPNLWLPNAYGMVLRRTTDNAWMRVTWDMDSNEPIIDNLGADPGATDYIEVADDLEWPAYNRGFGFYTTGVYRLIGLDDLKAYVIGGGTSAGDFATGFTMTKGLKFAIGKGPILRSPSNMRLKLSIDGSDQPVWSTL